MSRFVLRLPEELYRKVREQAAQEGVSINQYLLYSVTRMVTTQETNEFFAARAKGHNAKKALELLDRTPDREPDHPDDRMPIEKSRR